MATTPTTTSNTPLIPSRTRTTRIGPSSDSGIVGILNSIQKSLKKIESVVASGFALQKKQIDQQRKESLTKKRAEKERESENIKLVNPFKFLQGALPRTGFLDALKNFIIYTFMGMAFTKLYPLLPKVLAMAKGVQPFAKFLGNFVGAVFNNFVSAIDLGYKEYDKVRALAKQVGGEKFEKQFDDLSSALNKFLNTAIIVGLTIAGSGAVGGGGGKKLPTRISPRSGVGGPGGSTRLSQYFNQTRAQEAVTKKYGFDAARLYQDKINKGLSPAKALQAVRERFSPRDIPTGNLAGKGRTPGRIRARGLAKAPNRAALRLFGKGGAKILGKVPIVGPIIDFLVSTLIFKERPDRAAAGAVGGLVGAALGSFPPLIPFGGPIWGGIVGDIIGRSLFDAVVSMPKNDKVQKKAKGGQVTRGGRPIGRTRRVAPKIQKRLRKNKRQDPQPGKDIGGIRIIRKIYRSPKNIKPGKPNPLKTLEAISRVHSKNENPLFGGIIAATSNLTIGQKPDPSLKQEIKNNFATLIDNAISAQSAKDASEIGRSILAAANGGTIRPPITRTLNTGPTIGEKLGDYIATSFKKSLDVRTNEIFNSIRRQLGIKDDVDDGSMTPRPGSGNIIVSSNSPDFWLLATGAMFENSDPQGAADVAQVIYNRISAPGDPWKTNGNIRTAILSPAQFTPVSRYGGVSAWSKIITKEDAIRFATSNGKTQAALESVAAALLDTGRQRSARTFVGPRDAFRATTHENKVYNQLDDSTEVTRHGHIFGFEPGGAQIAAFKAGKLSPAQVSPQTRGTVTQLNSKLIEVGKMILQQGFTIGENKYFTNNRWSKFEPNPGGFNPRGDSSVLGHSSPDHATHAFDVTDHRGQPPQNKGEISRLTALFIHLYNNRNNYGIKALIYDHYGYWFSGQNKVTLGKYDGNHYDHLHVGFTKGAYNIPNQPRLGKVLSSTNVNGSTYTAREGGQYFKDGKPITQAEWDKAFGLQISSAPGPELNEPNSYQNLFANQLVNIPKPTNQTAAIFNSSKENLAQQVAKASKEDPTNIEITNTIIAVQKVFMKA